MPAADFQIVCQHIFKSVCECVYMCVCWGGRERNEEIEASCKQLMNLGDGI